MHNFDISIKSIGEIRTSHFLDNLPVVSSFKNLIDIFRKYANRHLSPNDKTHYYRYLDQKSYVRCVALCFPILGQLTVYLYDTIQHYKIKRLLKAKNYEHAATLGSVIALEHLAQAYDTGHGKPKDSTKAQALYRQAADRGGIQGLLNEIALLPDEKYNQVFPQKETFEALFETVSKHKNCYADISSILTDWHESCVTTGELEKTNFDVASRIIKICNRIVHPLVSSDPRPFVDKIIHTRTQISAALKQAQVQEALALPPLTKLQQEVRKKLAETTAQVASAVLKNLNETICNIASNFNKMNRTQLAQLIPTKQTLSPNDERTNKFFQKLMGAINEELNKVPKFTSGNQLLAKLTNDPNILKKFAEPIAFPVVEKLKTQLDAMSPSIIDELIA